MSLKTIIIVLSICLWPLNLYLANTQSDFLSYVIPSLLLFFSYFLYVKGNNYYLLPILLIGLIEKKLVITPLIFVAFDIVKKVNIFNVVVFLVSLSLLIINWSSFKGQTVFNKDYEMEQTIIRNTFLYPNVVMARVFQNKPRIYINKITDNFFALIDPNNYFFGFHPRQITVTNQNLYKFPFIAISFILYGIYQLKNHRYKYFLITVIVTLLANLSILQNFDRNDFILWVPLSIILIYGIEKLSLERPKLWKFLSILFLIFTIPQLLRSYVEKIL